MSRSLALRPNGQAVAALLAVEAHRRSPGPLAHSALLGTFTAAPDFLGNEYVDAEAVLKLKKGEAAARAEELLAGRRWVPAVLR